LDISKILAPTNTRFTIEAYFDAAIVCSWCYKAKYLWFPFNEKWHTIIAGVIKANCGSRFYMFSIRIHAGTGIPELTIDHLANQKILKYHRHVTDIIHEMKK
jgi:hypothetical protein